MAAGARIQKPSKPEGAIATGAAISRYARAREACQMSDDRLPPRIPISVTAAPFQNDGDQRWLVCIGQRHLLAHRNVAQKLVALSCPERITYETAYSRFVQFVADPEPKDAFVAWCECHRQRIEILSREAGADDHPLRHRRVILSGPVAAAPVRPWRGLFTPHAVGGWAIAFLAILAIYAAQAAPSSPSSLELIGGLALTLIGMLVHELGHIAACESFGVRHDGIGVGIYWLWPTLYADVRDAWNLPPQQRLLVSAGGLYFQSGFFVLMVVVWALTHNGVALACLQATLLLMLATLNPIFKFDGYWILSDLIVTTNLHERFRRHLRLMFAQRSIRAVAMRDGAATLAFIAVGASYLVYVLIALTGAIEAGWLDVAARWTGLSGAASSNRTWSQYAALLCAAAQLTYFG